MLSHLDPASALAFDLQRDSPFYTCTATAEDCLIVADTRTEKQCG
jgi:hypothetical protein